MTLHTLNRLRRTVLVGVSLAFAVPACAQPDSPSADAVLASIVQVRVVNETRRVATGSAVAVDRGVLVTSCHGLKQARAIQVLTHGRPPSVTGVIKDVDRDLCLLLIDQVLPPLAISPEADRLNPGDRVVAIGFVGPVVRRSEGRVRALHLYDGGNVIQTDAAFVSGGSGGALVDRDGRLVGILTFYAPGRRDSYFAVPVRWLRELLQRAGGSALPPAQAELSFWERAETQRPAFLTAAARQYAHDWEGLREVAARWIEQEPGSAPAWIALGKAHHHAHRARDAIAALEHAVELDPRQAAAWYYLGAAHRALDEPDGLQRALDRLDALDPGAARALRDGTPLE